MNRALFLAALFFTLPAAAVEIQAEYGQCRFGQAKDGTYYQSDLPHYNYLTPTCASLGVSFQLQKVWAGTTGWSIRASFLVAGSVEARDNLAPMNDGISDPAPCTNEHFANCHSLFGGSGRMRGVQIGLAKEQRLYGRWWAQAEAGALFFESYFNGYAKPQDFDGGPVVSAGAITGTSVKWEGGGLNQQSALWNQPLPMVGAALGYGHGYVAARYHFYVPREGLSITDGSMLQLTAGVRF